MRERILRVAINWVAIGLVTVTLTALQFHAAGARRLVFPRRVSLSEVTVVQAEGSLRLAFPGIGGSGQTPSVPPLVSAITFSSDGKLVAAALSNVIRIWDTKTGTQVREISVPVSADSWTQSLAFSADSAVLAEGLVGPGGRILMVWRVDTAELVNKFDREYSRSLGTPLSVNVVTVIAYSSDGKYLAFGTVGGPGDKLKVVDVESGKVIRGFVRGPAEVQSLTFSPDGKLAAMYKQVSTVPTM